ncbi:MAG: hypothetical protein K1060chlam5_01078 [Candidatus Anoxychlamydiales bacterium]|nr:hypothetical protein [Candidatus Anoxychlamydiales bacterium]
MKITEKLLHIPPYISTAWENIESLHTKDNLLIINLKNTKSIEIPNLPKQIIETIFNSHAKFIENKNDSPPLNPFSNMGLSMNSGSNLSSIDSITSAMKHNPDQKDMPDIPKEVLKKIATITKIFSDEASIDIPKPEANCNCPYCQISKAMQIATGVNIENLDEDVSEEDLKFRLWDIKEHGDKLYLVTNPLDHNEKYSVFLGDPIGCTCGSKNCEHIKSVLKT